MTKKKKHKHSLLIVLRFFKNKIVMRNSFSCKLEVCTVHSIYQPYLITHPPPTQSPPPAKFIEIPELYRPQGAAAGHQSIVEPVHLNEKKWANE